MTGSLFSVNTISGIPIIEAFSDSKVNQPHLILLRLIRLVIFNINW